MTTVKILRTALLATWMSAVGCDDAAPIDPGEPVVDLGPTTDGAPPDIDGGVTDAEPPDPDMADMAVDPDMAPGDRVDPTPGAPGVVAGGAQRVSDRFQATVTVGGTPTAARQSPRFQTRIGVGVPSISAQGAL